MKYLILFFKFLANVFYSIMKLLPITNKVVFISRNNTKTSIDFQLLKDEIIRRNKNCKVVILNHKIRSKLNCVFQIIQEMYHLATSRACIVDTYIIPVSILKHRDELIIIQIWHALGAIKKFGHAILDKKEGSTREVAQLMNMHENYDYVISGSEAMIPFFAAAFNVKEEIIKPYALPRVDYLLDKSNQINVKENILLNYPELKSKKVILYAPTFRKNEVLEIDELIKGINFNNYCLIIKKHPLDKTVIEPRDGIIVDSKFSVLDLLFITDYLITDYSAVSMEAAVLNIPMFYYVYDIDRYKANRGLFIDFYQEMPGVINSDAKEIIKAIENDQYDHKKIENFRQKYVSVLDGTSTKKIIDLIM